ncbi:hypothetical protein D3C84_566570 [compost metagenome]
MAVGQAGFQAEPPFAEEAAGLVVDVLDAARRGVVLTQAFAVSGGGLAGGGRAGETLWLRYGGLGLDLAYPLLQHHQGSLLGLVALAQFEQLLLQGLQFGVSGCVQGRREQGSYPHSHAKRE